MRQVGFGFHYHNYGHLKNKQNLHMRIKKKVDKAYNYNTQHHIYNISNFSARK